MERLRKIMADKTYRGTFAEAVERAGLVFETPSRPENTKGFVVEAKRWVVERTPDCRQAGSPGSISSEES